ncbi:MAG: hypothetical protein CL528_01880 [Aequorivita sp.]|nr:hypothetical protein [Aequorivita sp.]MBP40498.1 hypothetical protein [Aequorivita sp.]|tara:strand:+ start:15217 stop:16635 length:1419 start_codon:yes stop_codon:yes gene_type:complete
MPFNSLIFIGFFTFFVIVYYSVGTTNRKNIIALAGSYIFYAYAGISSILYLLLITIITYSTVRALKKNKVNKAFFPVSIISIILLLISSKYLNDIILQIVNIDRANFYSDSLLFTVGISFYSLQAISLIVEVAKNRYSDHFTFRKTALFISFFPQSLAGPIHRPQELMPQFLKPKQFNAENIVVGLKTLLFGFFIKLIVADKIALVILPVFEKWIEADGVSLIIAILFYSLQIYFDFWGYSLIAIGLGRILGFNIKINFNHPYAATSFKEFWHRWHISLSEWMRDYIYIPLGGREKGYGYFLIAVLVTFLISGIWHGLTFNFILWGILHAILYLLEDIKRRYTKNIFLSDIILFRLAKQVFFFVLISFTWLLFRTENINDLFGIIGKIFIHMESWSFETSNTYYLTDVNIYYILIALLTFSLSHTKFVERKINNIPTLRWQRVTDSVFICFCLISIILLGDIGSQEFLYFKF